MQSVEFRPRNRCSLLGVWLVLAVQSALLGLSLIALPAVAAEPPQGQAENVGDRLYLWGHRAGVYNDNFISQFKPSKIEPVAAADYMGLRNMFYIRCPGDAPPPFAEYYRPFEKLDRVVWSLTGGGGFTSAEERNATLQLAADNANVSGFIMDDFFHADQNTPPRTPIWVATNNVQFPVTLDITLPQPATLSSLGLAQSDWPSGDYRSREIAVEVSADGKKWQEVTQLTLPNKPGATADVALPPKTVSAIRLRILSTHDTANAMSCGLGPIRVTAEGHEVDTGKWKIAASSSFDGFAPDALLTTNTPLRAALSPEDLRDLRPRLSIGDRRLPLWVVVYTGQITPRARYHLQQVDGITLWTWRPQDLENLEDNLAKLEQLAPGKDIILGCYMFDFNARVPLSIAQMQHQVDLGYRWLGEGRIRGMIFLASPVCDLDLEAVELTHKWVADVKDRPLPVAAKAR